MQRFVPENLGNISSDRIADILSDARGLGASNAIEQIEAEGQMQFVISDVLPRGMSAETRDVLSAAGVVFGDIVPSDVLFRYAALPAGWRKAPTDYDMYSDLLDEKGRKRASIFYKASPHDRKADLSLSCRYSCSIDYHRLKNKEIVAVVTDCAAVIYSTDAAMTSEDGGELWELQNTALVEAQNWLDREYPMWKNPGAYWS